MIAVARPMRPTPIARVMVPNRRSASSGCPHSQATAPSNTPRRPAPDQTNSRKGDAGHHQRIKCSTRSLNRRTCAVSGSSHGGLAQPSRDLNHFVVVSLATTTPAPNAPAVNETCRIGHVARSANGYLPLSHKATPFSTDGFAGES